MMIIVKNFYRVSLLTFTAWFSLFATNSFAAFSSNSAGTSGAAFLKIGAGARPTGMGEAFTAVADDANAIYWNTAGLATLKNKNEFVAMRAELFQDLNYNFFSFAHPTKKYGTFALGLNNLNISEIEQRTSDTDTPDSTFSSNDSAYTIAYAQKVTMGNLPSKEDDAGLHLGGSVKFIRQTLAGETANSIAGDLGLLYRFEARPLNVAMAIQNLGSDTKFKDEADPLPMAFNLGTSYRFGEDWRMTGVKSWNRGIKPGILVSLDTHMPRDNDPAFRFGTEYTYGWSKDVGTSVRAGYRTDRSRQIDGSEAGISAGAGVVYKSMSFNFAWVPFGSLGNTFRYSIKVRF